MAEFRPSQGRARIIDERWCSEGPGFEPGQADLQLSSRSSQAKYSRRAFGATIGLGPSSIAFAADLKVCGSMLCYTPLQGGHHSAPLACKVPTRWFRGRFWTFCDHRGYSFTFLYPSFGSSFFFRCQRKYSATFGPLTPKIEKN
jgi:hypothetical protein